jgi:hypothetical protein
MADTPQKVTKELPPEPIIPAATLSMVGRATNSVGSTEYVGSRSFPASNLEPIQEDREPSLNPFISNQHTEVSGGGKTENIVDALIAQWHLSPTYQHARFLAMLIGKAQLEFDRNESKRKLCNLLRSLEESHNRQHGPLPFKFVPMEEIEKLDREQCRGNIALTENAPHIGDSAMEVARRWIEFQGIRSEEWVDPANQVMLDDILQQIREKGKKIKSPAELAIERKCGALFVGLFKFDDLIEITYVCPPWMAPNNI